MCSLKSVWCMFLHHYCLFQFPVVLEKKAKKYQLWGYKADRARLFSATAGQGEHAAMEHRNCCLNVGQQLLLGGLLNTDCCAASIWGDAQELPAHAAGQLVLGSPAPVGGWTRQRPEAPFNLWNVDTDNNSSTCLSCHVAKCKWLIKKLWILA